MIDLIFGNVWGWAAVAVVAIGASGAVAYFIPQFRIYAIALAGFVAAVAAAYVKGNRDRARTEDKRREEAVRNAQVKYDKIDKRPDTPADVARRLRNGDF